MSLTPFPHGISVMGVPLLPNTGPNVIPGNVYWVGSAAGANWSAGSNGSATAGEYQTPFATLDYAIGRCTADNFDVIYLLPGHAETITSSSTTIDVDGVRIIGLGSGSKRPTFTFSTAAATINVSGDNCSIENCRHTAAYADVVSAYTVAGTDFVIKNCLFDESTTDLNWLACISTSATANAADGLTIIGNTEISVDLSTTAFISILGNCDRLLIVDNYVQQGATGNVGHFITLSSKVCKALQILSNRLFVTGGTGATVGVFMTGSDNAGTGIVANNYTYSSDATTELFDTATLTFAHFENYYTGTVAKQGYLVPGADS